MSAYNCMVCGTEEPCQCPRDPLLEQVQRALRRLNIELIELRRRDAEKDAVIAQLQQALAAAETETSGARFEEIRARNQKLRQSVELSIDAVNRRLEVSRGQ